LPKEEYEALKESIKTEGQHYPIIINKKGIILDGHHRYRICQELQHVVKYEMKEFSNVLEEKRFVIESNLLRRQLTTFQRIEMALPLIEIEQEFAKQRMMAGTPVPNSEQGRTIEVVSEKIGVGKETLNEALWLMENAPKEELDKLRSGERAISNLYKETKRFKTIEELREKAKEIKAPDGLYDVIVVDPPWNYGTNYDPEGRRCASPYPELSIEEIKAIKLPLAENAIVWLWATNAFLHDAFHILEAWGLEPKTILTWVKDRMGLGDWLRGKTEHCILAIKGKPIKYLTNQTTVLFGESREHSRKPEEFYQLVDSLCYGRKLDYFGREKREGWDVYGTQELQTDN
jgi:N6-adenosine-specific RNA methylase IME4